MHWKRKLNSSKFLMLLKRSIFKPRNFTLNTFGSRGRFSMEGGSAFATGQVILCILLQNIIMQTRHIYRFFKGIFKKINTDIIKYHS